MCPTIEMTRLEGLVASPAAMAGRQTPQVVAVDHQSSAQIGVAMAASAISAFFYGVCADRRVSSCYFSYLWGA